MSFEYYISEKVYDKDRNLIKEVETDLIEYDVTIDGRLILHSWMLWSAFPGDWVQIDIEERRKSWPERFAKLEQDILDKHCDEAKDFYYEEDREAVNE